MNGRGQETGWGRAFAFLDRCGNNWTNGKGGCGILVQREVCNTISTAFNPLAFVVRADGAQGERMTGEDGWRGR